MTPSLESLGIDRLSVDERLALAEAIWDSIAPRIEAAPLTDAQKGEVERRLAAHKTNSDAAIPWDEDDVEALARMIRDHSLNPDETVRLLHVFRDYPPASHRDELEEELRCVLAARELANRPALSAETVDKARDAFASGRVPLVPQEMD